jgi:hypothetical protein
MHPHFKQQLIKIDAEIERLTVMRNQIIMKAALAEDKTNYMLESAAEHLGENIVGAQELGLKGIAQLVSTLFEVAVAVTSLAPVMEDESENAKIRLLHKHAMEGLEMIGGEEVVDDEDGDE